MEVSRAEVEEAAVRLLARREHSYSELTRKLDRRGWPAELVERVLSDLAERGLQSDQRYADSFARNRAGKAYGPLRIRAELAERGIDRALIDQTLRALEVDWVACVANWYARKYGNEPVQDLKERSRRMQVLARRGFAHEHIRELI
jgi:regulatory protein